MGKSLSEIVNAALTEADQAIKIASAGDAVMASPGDFLSSELGLLPSSDAREVPKAPREGAEPSLNAEPPKTASVLEDASFGLKLAAALETAASVVTHVNAKVASVQHTVDAPGPAVHRGQHLTSTTQHPKNRPSTLSAAEASHGGGPSENSQGYPNGIETNEKDYRDPNWTKNKEAAARLIRAKIAQAETLERLGQVQAAQQLLEQAHQIKEAADPSSPQAQLPAWNSSFRLDTDPGPASHVPDNSGLIALTRGSARNKTQREARAFFSEPAKTDAAVAAHVGRADGLKTSGLLQKVAKEKDRDSRREKKRPYTAAGTVLGSLVGAPLIGAGIGGAAEGYRHDEPVMGAARGAGGALLGAVGGATLGGVAGAGLGGLGGALVGHPGAGSLIGAQIGGGLGTMVGMPYGAHHFTRKYREEGGEGKTSGLLAAVSGEKVAREESERSYVPAAALGGGLGGLLPVGLAGPILGGGIGGAIEGARHGEAGEGALRGAGGGLAGTIGGALVGGGLGGAIGGGRAVYPAAILGGVAGGGALAHHLTRKYREKQSSKEEKSDRTPWAALGGGLATGLGGAIGGAVEGSRHGEAVEGALRGGGGGLVGGLIGSRLGQSGGLPGMIIGGGLGGGLGAHLLTRKYREKQSSHDPTQSAAARAYLHKVAALATDPDATPEERTRASSLIQTVRALSDQS